MGAQPLLGRVVVVAGDEPQLAEVAGAAVAAGAQVAVVSVALDATTAAAVRFRADPCDPGTWGRVTMHVEQHLGPVDGVAVDAGCRHTVEQVFTTDLIRRGHGQVVTVQPGDAVDAVLTLLCGKPPAAPSPPAPDAPRP